MLTLVPFQIVDWDCQRDFLFRYPNMAGLYGSCTDNCAWMVVQKIEMGDSYIFSVVVLPLFTLKG